MNVLLVCLKKLSNSQKANLKKHYSLLEFNKKIHLKKNIDQLGNAEVLLVQFDLFSMFSLQKNPIFQWLNKQVLTKFKVVFVYESSKYKNLLTNWSMAIRKLPLIVGKRLLETIQAQEDHDENTPSRCIITNDEYNSAFDNELDEEDQSPTSIIFHNDCVSSHSIKFDIEYLKKIEQNFTKFYLEFQKLKKLNEELKIELELCQQTLSALDAKETPPEPLKMTITDKDSSVVIVDQFQNILKKYPYSSKIQRRKFRKEALVFISKQI